MASWLSQWDTNNGQGMLPTVAINDILEGNKERRIATAQSYVNPIPKYFRAIYSWLENLQNQVFNFSTGQTGYINADDPVNNISDIPAFYTETTALTKIGDASKEDIPTEWKELRPFLIQLRKVLDIKKWTRRPPGSNFKDHVTEQSIEEGTSPSNAYSNALGAFPETIVPPGSSPLSESQYLDIGGGDWESTIIRSRFKIELDLTNLSNTVNADVKGYVKSGIRSSGEDVIEYSSEVGLIQDKYAELFDFGTRNIDNLNYISSEQVLAFANLPAFSGSENDGVRSCNFASNQLNYLIAKHDISTGFQKGNW